MSDDDTTKSSGPAARPKPTGLESLRAQLTQSVRERDAAKAALSDQDREEIELRRRISEVEQERAKADLERRELDLERRLQKLRAEHPEWMIDGLIIEQYEHSFILRANHRAYDEWSTQIAKAAHSKKIDRAAESRKFAAHCVVDWNGDDVSTDISHRAGELVTFLKNNAGIVDAIVNAGARLTGAFNRARKS